MSIGYVRRMVDSYWAEGNRSSVEHMRRILVAWREWNQAKASPEIVHVLEDFYAEEIAYIDSLLNKEKA